jgi:bifunctional DNA-binding transcriptional regulator/antitoxin component of YhaV-PrlF toxin-antitoxin module
MAVIMEAEAKLTAQNQITIPATVRKYLQLRGGVSRVKFQFSREGTVVLRVARQKPADHDDPALRPFLSRLEKDILKNPKRIVPFPAKLLTRARSAVKGVVVDLDAPLTGRD